jgi:hypothetical protein
MNDTDSKDALITVNTDLTPALKLYPNAWRGEYRSSIMSQAECDALRCGETGCGRTWRSAGGLAQYGGAGEAGDWRCIDHREPIDHSSHRLDLRQAHERAAAVAISKAVALAVIAERERIITMFGAMSPVAIYQSLVAQRVADSDTTDTKSNTNSKF